jgi:hypothetical protein
MSADAQVRHAAFYAACQALLYVLCYHMDPLLRPSRSRHQQQQQNQHQQQPEGGGGGAAGTPGTAGASAAGGPREEAHAAAAAAAAGGPAASSGGTPASADMGPGSLRSHERRDGVHAQVSWLATWTCAQQPHLLASAALPSMDLHAGSFGLLCRLSQHYLHSSGSLTAHSPAPTAH